eukprot:TRINITY_DN3872_c0_g3_i1.p1 TRINITY_DN3872_c0_g3~~TRINITY_DN3872_c0_g3_i1.p1  ORF type:complete len:1558 (+),score=276.45 TRINITY_DN3872_c0_g3_i1:65-4738(+)
MAASSDVRDIFRGLKAQSNGFLDSAEFKSFWTSLGLTSEITDGLFELAHKTQDGRIDMSELREWLDVGDGGLSEISSRKPSVVFVVGGPFSGKSTQCQRIVQTFGYTLLGVGDMLREAAQGNGPSSVLGDQVASCLREGTLVPTPIVLELIQKAMERHGWEGGKFLIDGFPRSFDNLQGWRTYFKGRVDYRFCIFLSCSQAVMEARCLAFSEAAAELDSETVHTRFRIFYQESMPVVEEFQTAGHLRKVDAEKDEEEVWQAIRGLFGPEIIFVLGGPCSGKSTHCRRIASQYGYRHLSVEDLLQSESQRSSSDGEIIKEALEINEDPPGEVTVRVLKRAMENHGWDGGKYVIEGFPQNRETLEASRKSLTPYVNIQFGIVFDCSKEEMENRLERLRHGHGGSLPAAATSSHTMHNGQRADGQQSSYVDQLIQLGLRAQFQKYRKDTVPVMDRLVQLRQVHILDAAKESDKVWQSVSCLFGPSIIFVFGGPSSGKRRQCIRISKLFRFTKLSIEHVLQDELLYNNHGCADEIKSCQNSGRLVGTPTLLFLLEKAMRHHGWEKGKFLFEGFPRCVEDLQVWTGSSLASTTQLRLAIFLECSEEAMRQRFVAKSQESAVPLSQDEFELQLRSYRDICGPAIEFLKRNRKLRKVDAGQQVEEVWTCLNEVLQWSLSPGLKNQALVFVKPHSHNEQVCRFVQSALATNQVHILKSGTVDTHERNDMCVFDRHYFQLVKYAEADAEELKRLPQSARAAFRKFFGADAPGWDEAVTGAQILSASAAMAGKRLSPQELIDAWDRAQGCSVAPDAHVRRLDIDGGVFVVNGFVPFFKESFGKDEQPLKWFWVEFDPAQVTWKQFREEVVGKTDPSRACRKSIRGQIYTHWRELGLKKRPDVLSNAVHASAGPLEGLREILLWAGVEASEVPLWRMLATSGVPQHFVDAWMENAWVENWQVGQISRQVSSGHVFDVSGECDTRIFLKAAVRQAQRDAGSLEPRALCAPSDGVSRGKNRRRGTAVSLGAVEDFQSTLPRNGPKAAELTLLHFNDVYNVEPADKEPCGGASRFVTRIQELRHEAKARGEPDALCVFGGDAFNPSMVSSVTKGAHMVPVLNNIGVDVAVVGNHDFDHGLAELEDMTAKTDFPWLCSNCKDKATGNPLGKSALTWTTVCGGRKVGFMGLVEQEWLVTLGTINQDDVVFEDFCACAKWLAKDLRSQGCELIVAITHMRVPNDELLAHEVEDIDLILGGHDHHYEVRPVGPHGTWLLKSGTDFRDITELRIRFSTERGKKGFEVLSNRHVEVTRDISEHPETKVLVDECFQKVGAAMEEVIGMSAVDLDCTFAAVRREETSVGNFITDVMRRAMKSDVAILNSGTLRADRVIEKGPFKAKDLVSILPILGEVCLLRLSGAALVEVVENAVSQYPRFEGRFPQVSGLSFTFDAALEAYKRVVPGSIKVGDQTLELEKQYTVCTTVYLRSGKDGFEPFKTAMCLADGEQCGILPTLVRGHFEDVKALNGLSSGARTVDAKLAEELVKFGDGPDPLKQWAISPRVEGRIVCVNPKH